MRTCFVVKGFNYSQNRGAGGVLEPDNSYPYIIRPAEWTMIRNRKNCWKQPARLNRIQ
jgi:hypothetical protein